MARAATTTDVFNAIAEPRRRMIIDLLAERGAHPVGALVETLQLPQPTVSKHLGVLRKVGIVSVSKRGQSRVYELNADQLRVVHEWVKTFERFWTHQINRIKEQAERKAAELAARKAAGSGESPPSPATPPSTPPHPEV